MYFLLEEIIKIYRKFIHVHSRKQTFFFNGNVNYQAR